MNSRHLEETQQLPISIEVMLTLLRASHLCELSGEYLIKQQIDDILEEMVED